MSAVVQHVPEADTASIISIIDRAARDPEYNVEKLERLFALQERMLSRNAEMAFNAAMRAAQEEMPKVLRNKKNDQTSSKYADLERLNEVIVPVYTRHGFSLSYGTFASALEGHIGIECDCSHAEGHTRKYRCDMPLDMTGLKGNQNKTPTHAHGSTMSYGRRYLALLIFNVTLTNEDTDGNKPKATITEEQLMDLKALAEEVNANKEAFLKYFDIAQLADLPATKYEAAVAALRKKAKKS